MKISEMQQLFINSNLMPKHIKLELGADRVAAPTRDDLQKIGFVYGKDVDEMCVECEIPKGWSKVPCKHRSFVDIKDEQSRTRAIIFSMFLEGKPWLRANVTTLTRFRINTIYQIQDSKAHCVVLDCEKVVFDAGAYTHNRFDDEETDRRVLTLIRNCNSFLEENYPDWLNPLAYW